MARGPHPLQRHFKRTGGPLASLLQRVSTQQAALQRVLALLPAEYRPHCLHADLGRGEALLLVDSPVWANRARYLAPTLLEQLRLQHPAPLKRLRIQISPPERRRAVAARQRHPTLSAQSAEALLGAAAATTDPALASALRRLARHGTESAD